MTLPKNRQGTAPIFKTVEDLDRLRNVMLGLPIRQLRHTIPWGYRVSDEPGMLEPVDEMFVLLVEAKSWLDNSTYKDIADWLSVESGVDITHEGVRKVMERRQPDDRAALPREEREKI